VATPAHGTPLGEPPERDPPRTRRAQRTHGTPGTRRTRRSTTLDLRVHRVRVQALRLLWTVAFLLLVFVPLAMVAGAGEEVRPWSPGGMSIELSLTMGLLALSSLAATVVIASRVRSLTEAFGVGGVLRSHRWLATTTVTLVLLHVAFTVLDRPANVALLDPLTAPAKARAGEAALVGLVAIGLVSRRRRRRPRMRYEVWRWLHIVLAVVVLVGTVLHIYWVDHLMRNVAVRAVLTLILLGVLVALINRWVGRPLMSWRHAYVVKAVRSEAPSISTLVLRPAGRGRRSLSHRPGQMAWLRLDSPFGALRSHPFTIASGGTDPRELEFTIRRVGDFTDEITRVAPGRRVFVDGPYGAFNADHLGARSLLLIGAGVGITPMMSMLRCHAARRDPRPHCLLLGAQTPAELLFREQLDLLRERLHLDVVEVVSRPPETWTGTVGRIDEELLAEVVEAFDLLDAHAFVCGPPAMVEDVTAALGRIGLPPHHVHTEEFNVV